MVFACTLVGAILAAAWACVQSRGAAEAEHAPAKGDRGIGTPGDAGLDLLRSEEVRNDLQITEEEEQKLIALGDEEGLKPAEARKKALAILAPAQQQRLRQIRLQVLGVDALAEPEVVQALGYTPQQRAMLKGLPAEVRQATREALGGTQNLTAEQRTEKTIEARGKVLKKALETLTPEQREKFEKLKGAKVDLDASEFWPK
jgi:Spy/CpxP family protein refolding chaperone